MCNIGALLTMLMQLIESIYFTFKRNFFPPPPSNQIKCLPKLKADLLLLLPLDRKRVKVEVLFVQGMLG